MNILILNWRDTKNPRSGGAEIITQKYADYWAHQGHKVYWISNYFSGSSSQEESHKVKYLRVKPILGFSVLALIVTYPVFLISSIVKAVALSKTIKFDLVIDEIHGLPFFSPIFFTCRKILLVCEVAGPIWDKMFPFPINIIGKIIEHLIYKFYKNVETWTISKNTKSDVFKINQNPNITILPLGIDLPMASTSSKFLFPSAVFLGRLVKMKGVESAINSVPEICKALPKFKLYIIGNADATYLSWLKSHVDKLRMSSHIEFLGFLPQTKRNFYLHKCNFLIHPSYKEGFGLTVIEAGVLGTPTIARKGSSLDELIHHNLTGLLFTKDSDIPKLFVNNYSGSNYRRLSLKSSAVFKNYSWKKILTNSKKITGI